MLQFAISLWLLSEIFEVILFVIQSIMPLITYRLVTILCELFFFYIIRHLSKRILPRVGEFPNLSLATQQTVLVHVTRTVAEFLATIVETVPIIIILLIDPYQQTSIDIVTAGFCSGIAIYIFELLSR